MKRLVQRAALIIGLFALVAAFAAPSAEAGRRHHYRRHVHRIHHAYHVHRGVHRVHVRTAPVVVVPVAPVVPYYGHYRGPSVYIHSYGW